MMATVLHGVSYDLIFELFELFGFHVSEVLDDRGVGVAADVHGDLAVLDVCGEDLV